MDKPTPEDITVYQKKARHILEHVGLVTVIQLFNLFPADKASDLAGKCGRMIGPYLPSSRTAMANLQLALPGREEKEYRAIIAGMWDNLARLIVEYPNLDIFAPDIELAGFEHLRAALEEKGQVIIFSGHIGSWEIVAPCLFSYQLPIDMVYRAPNNPYTDKALNNYRTLRGQLRSYPKSKAGTRKLVEAVQAGRSVLILIDQKYNEGIDVPFFGHNAKTSTAFVQLGQKYECPVLPFRVERLGGTRFRLSFYPPLKTFDEQGQPRPYEAVIGEAHTLLESWIIERPEQWLWNHRRWGKLKEPPGQKIAVDLNKFKKKKNQ